MFYNFSSIYPLQSPYLKLFFLTFDKKNCIKKTLADGNSSANFALYSLCGSFVNTQTSTDEGSRKGFGIFLFF